MQLEIPLVNLLFENGDRRTAKIVGRDSLNDIAVLKIVENLSQHVQQPKTSPLPTPLIIGNSSNLRIGQPLLSVTHLV